MKTASILVPMLFISAVSCVSHRDSPAELADKLLSLQHEDEIFQSYQASVGSLFGGESEELKHRFEKEMTWESLKPEFIAIYTNTYSLAELRSFVEFYSSPAGKARNVRWKQTRDKIQSLLEEKRAGLLKETKESRTKP